LDEASTLRWALRYVAQGLGQTHLKVLLENENMSETGFGERVERLMAVADRIEKEFDLSIFD
jgi:hypothetical protein